MTTRHYNILKGKERLKLAAWCSLNKDTLNGTTFQEVSEMATKALEITITYGNIKSMYSDLDKPWIQGRKSSGSGSGNYTYQGKYVTRGEIRTVIQAILDIDTKFDHGLLSDDMLNQLVTIHDRKTRESKT